MMKLVDFQLGQGSSALDEYGASYDCLALPLQYGDEMFVAIETIVGGGGFGYFADVIGPGTGGGLNGPFGAASLFGRGFDTGIAVAPSGILGMARKRIYSASDPEGLGVDDLTADGTGQLSRIGYRFPAGSSNNIMGGAWATWVFRGDGKYTKAGLDSAGVQAGDGGAQIDIPQVFPLAFGGSPLRSHQALLGMAYGEVYNNNPLDGPDYDRLIDVEDDSGYEFRQTASSWTNSFDARHDGIGHRAIVALGKHATESEVTFTVDSLLAAGGTDNWVTGALLAVVNFTTGFDAAGTDSWSAV